MTPKLEAKYGKRNPTSSRRSSIKVTPAKLYSGTISNKTFIEGKNLGQDVNDDTLLYSTFHTEVILSCFPTLPTRAEHNSPQVSLWSKLLLLVGVDIPNISYIYHIGIADSLLEYVQQSGRTGRNVNSVSEVACTIYTTTAAYESLRQLRLGSAKLSDEQSVRRSIQSVINYCEPT
ncbi:hypothetical protein BDF20DRAFT_910891 [Mycotypha africana]|uniref:uncharacterized protein n=1 Tax=Mycotypha africana TaxID=64632 RepID=UPI002301D562|nr:uncharacterized protein BDF20DRAFT_910891 [Mycotypha africana]KAI8988404.1 hypothetical protein BDF20DRAFT_910891 [Mycotypha africana]